jgi:glycosyltransferase involved in cell wall biosynthesis
VEYDQPLNRLSNDQLNPKDQISYVAPDFPWTRWTNSGVSLSISDGLLRRGMLRGAVSRWSRYCVATQLRSASARKIASRLHAFKTARRATMWMDENEGSIGRWLRKAPSDSSVLYHYLTPNIDSSLQIRRFLFQDIAVDDAVRSQGWGHDSLTDSEIASARKRQSAGIENAEGVVVFANFAKASLIRDYGTDPSKIHVIGAAPFLNRPAPINFDAKRYRAKKILFVGRAWERKGGPELLSAFEILRSRMPDAKLTIVSSGFTGNVPEGVEVHKFLDEDALQNLFSETSVFCMPSRAETWGLVYTEALRFGAPIVGFREWALPDIAIDGQTGFLAEPRSAETLAAALEDALSKPDILCEMGRTGVHYVSKVLTWDAVLDRLVSAINPHLVEPDQIMPVGVIPT